jgi:heme/copper-type cytochrome/quinol oxidase subunit 2
VLCAALLLVAAACASGSDDSTARSSSSAGIASGEPNPAKEPVTVTVSVTDGKVSPKPSRVKVPLGSTVELQVTSDVDDELHVHGFDVEKPLEAGITTTVELQADEAGLYEVETHETELELLQLEVR